MNEIRIPLNEINLAEVLTGIAILGIAELHHPEENKCHWEKNTLVIHSPSDEATVLGRVCEFVENMRWIPASGEKHQGVFRSGDLAGLAHFMEPAGNGTPSIFKTFSGDVNPESILAKQSDAWSLEALDGFSSFLRETASGASSWALDCRTTAHSLDEGFSAYDAGASKSDPVFLAVELLSASALSFFLPPQALGIGGQKLGYFLWSQRLPARLASLAFIGRLSALPGVGYELTRRPKSYGKGSSYKFFPNATPLTNSN